jgi:hypothetical protein
MKALALAGCLCAASLQAQAAPLVLQLPAGARALSLGDAFVAGRSAEVIFYNPAQIAQGTGMMLTGARYGSASTQLGFAATTALGAVTVGFGAQYLNFRPPLVFGRPGDLGESGTRLGSSLMGGVAVSLRWKGLRWGAGAKYGQDQVEGSRSGHALFDFGVGREIDRFTVGLAVQHLGGDYTVNGALLDAPTRVTIGGLLPRYPIGTYFDIGATAAVAMEHGGRIVPGAGVELYYQPLEGWSFVLRAGAHRTARGPNPKLHPLTLGAGIAWDRFALDYAFEAIRGGGATHRIGIRLQ